MIDKVSKLISLRCKEFMEKVLADDEHCTDSAHKHEDVKETSLLFREVNFGMKRWKVDLPTSGFASFVPLFTYNLTMVDEEYSKLEKAPSSREVEKFISRIMQAMRLSNEVCLLGFIFLERLLKKGNVQLLTINWRPLVYTAFLLASKYWEDY